jgi:hypothetical protein
VHLTWSRSLGLNSAQALQQLQYIQAQSSSVSWEQVHGEEIPIEMLNNWEPDRLYMLNAKKGRFLNGKG